MSYTNGLDKPTDYFNTKLYTGNGGTQSITGVGFQPDWCWFKMRSHADNHVLIDSVRGTNKAVYSDLSDVESTQTHYFSSFDSDGFSLGNSGIMNASGRTYASWNWLASNTTASNTDGSITSTVSANTTSGFSIVSYTGTGSNPSTVGHGLGAVPKMIIVKNRDQGTDWNIYHQGIGNANTILLNTTNASFSSSVWNSTTPTSSVFSLGANDVNTNTIKYIAYCFAEKKGFSKFGSYTGNGSTDGTFVYTGFKPAMVICKKSSASGTNWGIIDNKRANSFNEISAMLNPNSSGTEGANNNCDFVSNGFKWRSSDGNSNTSGDTFIYMAFASEPFTTSTGIPCTAR